MVLFFFHTIIPSWAYKPLSFGCFRKLSYLIGQYLTLVELAAPPQVLFQIFFAFHHPTNLHQNIQLLPLLFIQDFLSWWFTQFCPTLYNCLSWIFFFLPLSFFLFFLFLSFFFLSFFLFPSHFYFSFSLPLFVSVSALLFLHLFIFSSFIFCIRSYFNLLFIFFYLSFFLSSISFFFFFSLLFSLYLFYSFFLFFTWVAFTQNFSLFT